jgi:hypothetical protein
MWINIVERDRPQVAIWRMRIACWMPEATNAHSEHVILIAFPQQQWLHEHAQCYIIRTLLVCFLFVYPFQLTTVAAGSEKLWFSDKLET